MNSAMTFGAIWAVIGLGLGFGLAYLFRRWRGTSEQKKRAATPTVYASRQEARKAEREQRKRQAGR